MGTSGCKLTPSHRPMQCVAGDATLQVSTKRQVGFGETHKLVGGHPALGNWDVGSAPAMNWSDGNVWTVYIQLPVGAEVEFKVGSCRHTLS